MSRPKIKNFSYITGKKYDGMMGRCYRPTESSYSNYGAKGIRVCESWILDINEFRVWVLSEIERTGITLEEFIEHSNSYQLDRVRSDGHYTPDNCRIVSRQVNSRNKMLLGNSIQSAEGSIIDLKTESNNERAKKQNTLSLVKERTKGK